MIEVKPLMLKLTDSCLGMTYTGEYGGVKSLGCWDRGNGNPCSTWSLHRYARSCVASSERACLLIKGQIWNKRAGVSGPFAERPKPANFKEVGF